ncbi:MAG TPA: HupE/UreJ family protein [Candidatus Udaeobacter sp.]|jgi:hydrogenase/urease accessory protein HupE
MKRVLWLTLLLMMGVPSAHAHLMNTGLGPFYDGLTHLVVTPEDLLPVIALALFAGLCGPQYGRVVLFVLPAAWLAGAVVGASSDTPLTLPVTTALMTVAFGVLVVMDRQLPLRVVVACALVLGVFHGSLNGTDLSQQRAPGLSVIGIAVALFVVVSLLAGQVTSLRLAWARVVVRVAGSWIAATGLLMLGWAVRVRMGGTAF